MVTGMKKLKGMRCKTHESKHFTIPHEVKVGSEHVKSFSATENAIT